MCQAVAYYRISRDDQSSMSIQVQRAAVRRWAAGCDVEIVAEYEDRDVSGGTEVRDREAGRRMLAYLEGDECEVDALVVAKLDRLGRDSYDLQGIHKRLDRRGVSLLSQAERIDTSTAAGYFAFQMYCAMGEYELRRIQERCRDQRREARRQGRHTGGAAPFGYRVGEGNVLEARPGEHETLEEAFRLYDEEGLSYRQAADALNEAGLLRRNGKPWDASKLHRMMQRERERREARNGSVA